MPLVRWQVPAEINEELSAFAQRVVKGGEPIFVPVRPPIYTPANFCFQNVDLVVRMNGGRSQFGWYFHEDTDQLLFQAVFHSVWVSPEGELVDVTPHNLHAERILFLPDPTRLHRGKFIPNQFYARVDDPVVHELIRVIEKEVSYWDLYHNPKRPMQVQAPRPALREIKRLHTRLEPRLRKLRQRLIEERQRF